MATALLRAAPAVVVIYREYGSREGFSTRLSLRRGR